MVRYACANPKKGSGAWMPVAPRRASLSPHSPLTGGTWGLPLSRGCWCPGDRPLGRPYPTQPWQIGGVTQVQPPTRDFGDLLHPVGRSYPRTAVRLGRLRCSRRTGGVDVRGNFPLGALIPPDRVRQGGTQDLSNPFPCIGLPCPCTAADWGDSGASAKPRDLVHGVASLWASLSHLTVLDRGDSGGAAVPGKSKPRSHPIGRPYPRANIQLGGIRRVRWAGSVLVRGSSVYDP